MSDREAIRNSFARRALSTPAWLGAVALVAGVLAGGGYGGGTSAAPVALAPNHPTWLTSAGHGHGKGRGGGTASCPTGTALGWASSNWSGYAETCKAPYSGVSGSWVVPGVGSSPQNAYSATWLGIDGFDNASLIQTGTEQDVDSSGHASYGAWWTTSSNQFVEQVISSGCSFVAPGAACGAVQAHDEITADVTEVDASTAQWAMTIADGSAWRFTKTVTYRGPGASAEWIVEAPTVGGRIAALAHFESPLTFNPDDIAGGTINGGMSPALTYPEGGSMISGHGRFVTTVAIPSGPDSDQDGFDVSYGSVPPPAPSS